MLKLIVAVCCLISPIFGRLTITSISTSPDGQSNQNPHWDDESGALYFADQLGTLLYRYTYATNQLDWLTVDGIENPGFFMPVRGSNHQYAVGSNEIAYIINWDGYSPDGSIDQEVFSVQPGSFLSSATVSSRGEFYVGNFGADHCSGPPVFEQYGYKKNNELNIFADHYVSTTGAVLVEAERTFYHLDRCRKTITAFDWNPITGRLSSERLLIVLEQYPESVVPTGLTADIYGFLYTGLYNGSAIAKIDPSIPAVVEEIELPTPYINAPQFGGPNNDILFVPSATLPFDVVTSEIGDQITDPPAGDLFIIRGLGTTGVPSFRPYMV